MKTRPARFAGQFYPADSTSLTQFFNKYFQHIPEKKTAKAILMPHAGYIYSGKTACRVISRIHIPPTVLMMGPNHTGLGAPFSVMQTGAWDSPFGPAPIDAALSARILERCPLIEENEEAHQGEHSLEVELPFLKYIRSDVKIVPLCIASDNFDELRTVGEGLAEVLKPYGKEVLIVVSSDMTHYESEASARKKDRQAIDAIIELDEKKLAKRVREFDISMCGFLPAYCMLVAAKELGATKAELVDYSTSGETSGDYGAVVGYAGMIIW